MTFIRLLLFLLLFHAASACLQAQSVDTLRVSGSYPQLPFTTFVQQLEARYPLRFFFVEEWVSYLRVDGDFRQQPLRSVLEAVFRDTGLSYVLYDSHYIVLMKSAAAIQAAATSGRGQPNENRIVVGDSVQTQGQTATVSGYVRDAATGEGMAGATVFVEELQQGIATNLNGFYSLTLPAGIYHWRISSMGYEEERKSIRVLSGGTLHLDLFENTARLEEIVITEQAEDVNVTGTQMSAARLDIQKVRKLPAFLGETDLLNTIEMLPGVSVAGEGAAGFHVRGGDAGQNLVLLDGIPVYNPSHLFGFFSAFNADMLQDATLYKGGIPAQYGGRLSSVLDVRLKEANLRKVQGSGGLGLVSSRLALEVPLVKDKSSLLLGGRASYSDWILRQLRDIRLRQSEASFYDANARFNYRFNEKHKISLTSYLSHDDFAYAGENSYSYGNQGLAARWNFLISPALLSEFSLTYARFSYEAGSRQDSSRASSLASGFTQGQAQLGITYFFSDRHQWDMGVQATAYQFDPGALQPVGAGSLVIPTTLEQEQAQEMALYFNDEFAISRNMTLNYGLRYAWYFNLGPAAVYRYQEGMPQSSSSITDTLHFAPGETIARYHGPEPRLSFRYGINGRSSIKLSYNRLRQYTHLISNTTSITPTDIWKLSDSHILPQTGDQLAAGYFRNSIGNAIESSVEIYYKRIQGLVEYKNGAQLLMNEQLEADLLSGTGRAYGLELSVSRNIGRLTGWLAYTWARSLRRVESEFREERINLGRFYPSSYDKPHELTMAGNYQFTRRLRMGVNFTYSSGRPVTLPEGSYQSGYLTIPNFSERNQYRIPSYHRLDLSFSLDGSLKKEKKWDSSWTFSVYNLYGRKNPFTIFFRNSSGGELEAYRLSILGRPFPSVTYNFKF